MLVGIVSTAHATQTEKCATRGHSGASCPDKTKGEACTLTTERGEKREGKIVAWDSGKFSCRGITAPPPKDDSLLAPNATLVNKIPSNAGGTVAAPAKYEGQLQHKNMVLHRNRAVKEDVIRGKVALKPQIAIVVLRDSETKKIIDMTTTDSAGNFVFENMTFRQGLELGWGSPQEIGEPDDDDVGFCYRNLPYDFPVLKPMECEDVEFDFELEPNPED